MKEFAAILIFLIVIVLLLYYRVGCWVRGGVMAEGFLYPRCIKAEKIPTAWPWES